MRSLPEVFLRPWPWGAGKRQGMGGRARLTQQNYYCVVSITLARCFPNFAAETGCCQLGKFLVTQCWGWRIPKSWCLGREVHHVKLLVPSSAAVGL